MTKQAQAPNTVLMVRPAAFYPNPDTDACNSFQSKQLPSSRRHDLLSSAQAEFDLAVDTLMGVGIEVRIVQDSAEPSKPDAIFPNNWFSTHGDGTIAIYPMYSPSRRHEKEAYPRIEELLSNDFIITRTLDLSHYEREEQFLEGTGVLCLDHASRICYVGLSNRADAGLIREVCSALGFEPMIFNTADAEGTPVYHTNVLLSIGTEFALLGSGMMPDARQREGLIRRLEQSGKKVIELSNWQVNEFAGNAIELTGRDGRYLAVSQRGENSLTAQQKNLIQSSATLLSVPLPTVELSGGSMRCMIAGIHLAAR